MPARVSAAEARRIALAAQGFAEARPTGRVDARHFRRVMQRIGLVQLDAVNVLVRSHYLPFFSRLGAYDRGALDRHLWSRDHFEYWGHEASVIPVEAYPLFRHRMAGSGGKRWVRPRELLEERPGYLEAVVEEIRRRGPLTASDLEDPGQRTGPWWGWNHGKIALEWLFANGVLTANTRRQFQRLYDLPERALPSAALDAPAPEPSEAIRELLLRSARHHGIGTARDLADYYRVPVSIATPHLRDLAAEGSLEIATVEGWGEPAYLYPQAKRPRAVRARALITPFDPIVWERGRAERLFDFRYRIELYTPPAQRQYGYYVLPFLLGDRLVARVDVKADRAARTLLVPSAFAEAHTEGAETVAALAEELRLMAAWLGLDRVQVGRRGDLATPLRAALR